MTDQAQMWEAINDPFSIVVLRMEMYSEEV